MKMDAGTGAAIILTGAQSGGTENTMADQITNNQDELMDAPELYTLVDEEGNEKLFELIDVLEEDGKVYFALIPHVENPAELLEECELVVLAVQEGEDGADILVPIESDDEYERIAQIFIDRLEDEVDEEDEAEDAE